MERLKSCLALGFLHSDNKETYRIIGKDNNLSPLRVYQLAHGRHPADIDERKAREALLNEGIIGRR